MARFLFWIPGHVRHLSHLSLAGDQQLILGLRGSKVNLNSARAHTLVALYPNYMPKSRRISGGLRSFNTLGVQVCACA